MQFRLSAVQDQGMPASMDDARCALEDALNAQLRDTDFGCAAIHILIVVFCAKLLPQPAATSRLTRLEDGTPLLALHVVMDPDLVRSTPNPKHLQLLCTELATRLPRRPARKPKGLDYERLLDAAVKCMLDAARGAA